MIETCSYINLLGQKLQTIENKMMDLLDSSTIKERDNFYDFDMVRCPRPSHYWGETDERQKVLQMGLQKDYFNWLEHINLLFENGSKEIKEKIQEIDKFIKDWINKKQDWDVPSTIQEAKKIFKEKIQVFYQLLKLFEVSGDIELILIPDTNALITAPDVSQYSSIAGQSKYSVIIVPTVLAELDKLKIVHRDNDLRKKVDSVIKRIKGFRNQGSLLTGVTLNKTIKVKMIAHEPNFKKTLHWLDPSNEDDRIISSSLEIQREYPSAMVNLVTLDINLQNKAEMAMLPFLEPPEERQ